MIPSEIISSTFDRDNPQTITLTCNTPAGISVIGCSEMHSAFLDEPLNSFTISLPTTHMTKGVVAIRSEDTEMQSFLITFERSSLSPIDLAVSWVPINGRLGQIYPNGSLIVTIDKHTYGTDAFYCDHIVNDPDLLCTYLSGNVDDTAILAVAERTIEEQREIDVLRNQIADMRSEDRVRIMELESSLDHCNKAMIDLLDTVTINNDCATQLEQEKKRNKRLEMHLERADRFIIAINELAFTHSLGFWCSKSMHQIRQRLSYYWN